LLGLAKAGASPAFAPPATGSCSVKANRIMLQSVPIPTSVLALLTGHDNLLLTRVAARRLDRLRVVLCQAVHRSDEREVGLEPLGLAYISSYVSAHLPETEFFYAENVDEVLSRDPEIVGISTVSQNYDVASHLARELRERSYTGPLLLGGFHISALPTSLSSEFDAGVIGEGEQTMLEMVRLVGAHVFGSGHLLPLERRAGDDLGTGADQAAGPDSTTRQGYAFGTVAPCSGGASFVCSPHADAPTIADSVPPPSSGEPQGFSEPNTCCGRCRTWWSASTPEDFSSTTTCSLRIATGSGL